MFLRMLPAPETQQWSFAAPTGSPVQPSPAQLISAQPSSAQPSSAQPSSAQPSPAQPSPASKGGNIPQLLPPLPNNNSGSWPKCLICNQICNV
uniref:Uncharacterized protein n=1 Tax=Cyanistes caeruleus TaxID=156563 RepID=A0A8C0Z7T4_CYACU